MAESETTSLEERFRSASEVTDQEQKSAGDEQQPPVIDRLTDGWQDEGQGGEQDGDQEGDKGEAEAEAKPAEPETVEIELDGQKYEVPKELKDHFLRQQDYTRKTMDLADQRRAVEEQQAKQAQEAQEYQARAQLQQGYAQLEAAKQRLEQFRGIDWNRLQSENPDAAQSLFREYSILNSNVDKAERILEQQSAALQYQQAEAIGRMRESGLKAIQERISGWNDQTGAAIVDYYIGQGGNEAEIRGTLDPLHVQMVHKAMLYDKLMANATAKAPKPEAKPVAKVKGGGKVPAPLSDEASINDWMKQRNKQASTR